MTARPSALYSKLGKSFLSLAVWLICFFALVELILRLAGFFYLKLPDLGKSITKNNINIVCLGDSNTYGWGVKREEAYPKQLEKILNEDAQGKRNFKVFNLGIPGSNSSQHLKYLEETLNKNKNIDLVIVLTGANDPWNFADSNIYKFQAQRGLAGRLNIKLQILLSDLRVYKMVKIILLNAKGMPPEAGMNYFKQIKRAEFIDAQSLQELLEYNLTEMIKLAQIRGIKIIFQSYPAEELKRVCLTQQVALLYRMPFVNHAEIFHEELKKSSYADLFLYDNFHPNKRGYGIMARDIYDVIVSENIFGDK